MTFSDASFILGCQRSGTTLLRFLLASHPDVCSIDEEHAYPVLTGRKTLSDDIAAGAKGKRMVFKIPRFAEQLLLPDVRDETYGTCPQFYDRQRAIFIVRDPRDVVASMCTLAANREQTWIQAYGRSMIEHRVQHRPSFAQKYASEIAQLAEQSWPSHLLAAFYWRVKNDVLSSYATAGLPIQVISYEELVVNPQPVLQRTCEHLGLSWTDTMLEHHNTEHNQLDASGLAIGGSDPKRPIDSKSVGRFAEVLDRRACQDVIAWTGEHFDRLRASC